MSTPTCCGEVVWVENIAGKGYNFCRGCKNEVVDKPNFSDTLFLKEVWRGWFKPKRYYFGWAQNVHNFQSCGFLLEAEWYDSLSEEMKKKVYERELHSAYLRSLPRELKRGYS